MSPSGWNSALSSQLFFQYRLKESASSYRVLLGPREALTPISTLLPPTLYENLLYIDVIDTLGNYITIKQPVISKVDTMMTATQFAVRINNVTQTIIYTFDEVAFEQTIFKLKMYYQAYGQDQLNTENQPQAFFKILSESTIDYLYNTFVVDKRLN